MNEGEIIKANIRIPKLINAPVKSTKTLDALLNYFTSQTSICSQSLRNLEIKFNIHSGSEFENALISSKKFHPS